MNENATQNIKKLLNAMEELLEAVKLQQEMVQMVMERQIKTMDYVIKMAKALGYSEKGKSEVESLGGGEYRYTDTSKSK